MAVPSASRYVSGVKFNIFFHSGEANSYCFEIKGNCLGFKYGFSKIPTLRVAFGILLAMFSLSALHTFFDIFTLVVTLITLGW